VDETELIVTVPRASVDAVLTAATGWIDGGEAQLLALLAQAEARPRTAALEQDERHLQLVPVALLSCVRSGRPPLVFTYRRRGAERRLHDRLSLLPGGHLRAPAGWPLAASALFAAEKDDLHRELAEEFGDEHLPEDPRFPAGRLLGFLRDDYSPVGRVHLGIVHHVRLTEPVLPASDDVGELGDPVWVDPDTCAAAYDALEPWGQLVSTGVLPYLFPWGEEFSR
jgi:predicted NUDIX family phosphoesterase